MPAGPRKVHLLFQLCQSNMAVTVHRWGIMTELNLSGRESCRGFTSFVLLLHLIL